MARVLASGAAVLVLATGCGDAPSPAQQVPSLADRLSAVDQAVAAHDDAATLAALDDLERTARAARRTGDLDAAQVQAILDAAESVRAALPATDTTTTEPSPTPSETPSTRAEHRVHDRPAASPAAGQGEEGRAREAEEGQARPRARALTPSGGPVGRVRQEGSSGASPEAVWISSSRWCSRSRTWSGVSCARRRWSRAMMTPVAATPASPATPSTLHSFTNGLLLR